MRVVHRPNRGHRANGGGVMEAFYSGLALLHDEAWDYLVKLDGDLSFAPDYFERCFAMFERDPNLNNLRQDARFVALLARMKQQWERYRTI